MSTKAPKQMTGLVATTIADFLGLSPAEESLIATKVRFTILVKQARTERGWTQAQLAQALETTQQAVARAERGGASVSLDFLLRALVTLGFSLANLGNELRALDAVSQSEVKRQPHTKGQVEAACHEASPCAATESMSSSSTTVSEIKPLERENLVSAQKVAADAQTPAPVLRLIRGGFQGTSVAASGDWRFTSPSCGAGQQLRAATG